MKQQFAVLGHSMKQALTLLGDLIIVNLLFIVCSIPVATMGASIAASYTGLLRVLRGERVGVSASGFFKDFAAVFKKATGAWLLQLASLALLAGDIWFAVVYSEPDNVFFLIFACVLGAGVLLAAVWLYPLVARFENTLGAHIKNAVLMMLARFPKTLLVLLLQAAFLAVPLVFFDVFAYLGWFWLLFGASLPMYLTAKAFKTSLQCEPKEAGASSDAPDIRQ